MLTFRQIEVFRAVMRSGTLVGAARLLKITQPTITKTLLRIEDVVGLSLFERTPGRIAPTSDAHRLLFEVDRAFNDLEIAIGRALDRARETDGTFRLGTSPSIGRTVVPDVLARMTDATPRLSVQVEALSVAQILDYVLEGTADCAVGLFPIVHARVRSQNVGHGRLVAVLPRVHRLREQAVIAAPDLADEALITFEPHTIHGQAIAAFLGGIAPGPTHRVRFAETAIGLAEAGLGVALVDAFSALSYDERRAVLRPTALSGGFDVYLHTLRDRPRGRFTNLFRIELQKTLAGLTVEAGIAEQAPASALDL